MASLTTDETNSNIDNNNSSSSEEMEKLNEENEKKLNAMKISKQFTEEELEGIKTFRSRIKGKIADLKDDSFEKMYYNEDTTIWRYVLAQSQESDPMEKSEQMFFDSIKWRKDIKMYETLWEEWRGNQGKKNTKLPNATTARARLGDLIFYSGIMESKSTTGGPVLVEKMGKADLKGLYYDEYALSSTEISYIIYLEESWKLVRKAGEKTRGMIVVDVEGAGLSTIGYISVVKRISKSGVMQYPEITERVNMINSGWFFSTLWSAVKAFLPSRTKGKFRVLNSNFHELIFADVVGGGDSLPSFIGGKLEDGVHSVCPAMSVLDAYGVVVDEVVDGKVIDIINGSDTNQSIQYKDAKEFMEMALNHAKNASQTEEIVQRIEKIESWLSKQK